MSDTISPQLISVECSLPRERLDKFLAARIPGISRSTLQRWMDEGCILVNGAACKAMQSPRAGDQISIEPHEARPTLLEPQAIPLEILFEDDDLLVINKPEELVVHPGPGHEDGTIVNAVLHHCRGQLSGIGGVERPGIVHRLDLGTSGCLVIAKNDTAHLSLSEQFGGRIVEKTYQCIACGRVEPVRGEIRIPIGRHAVHRQKMAVTTTTRGKEAWTSFRVLEQMKHAAWVELKIHTGRTHQIRVHLQHLGFPVLGDEIYGARPSKRVIEETGCVVTRQLLHAYRLAFNHPRTQKRVDCEAPLPADFQNALKSLR